MIQPDSNELNPHNSCDFEALLAQTVLDSLSAHIAILDENGVILETNQAWRDYALQNGMPSDYDSRGSNYLSICDAANGMDEMDARKIAKGIRSVIKGEIEEFLHDYPCHSPLQKQWYYMRVIRMGTTIPVRVVISHENITALKLTEEALLQSKLELESRRKRLEESNIALRVLLEQRAQDKTDLEQKVLSNLKEQVFPYLEKLKRANLKTKEKKLLAIITEHLDDIISPFLSQISSANILLTPQEIKVASLVKDGRASKEIADILHVSEATVHFHRKNLRDKFGLKNKQTNLRTYLMSLTE
jgi:DNA-binding CsgD family transcriptional regulator